MEDIVGRTLFVRGSRSVRLTRAGIMLVEHGRRLLALNGEMLGRFVKSDITGVVRFGAPDDVAERFLPEMLRRFSDDYPGLIVKVMIDHSERMIEMVQRGDLDMTVITAEAGIPNDPDAEIVYREPLVWAGLSGGVAIEKTPLPLAVWEPHCVWRKIGLDALDAEGRDYRIVFECSEASGQRAAILADMAVAQIPVSSLGDRIVEIPPPVWAASAAALFPGALRPCDRKRTRGRGNCAYQTVLHPSASKLVMEDQPVAAQSGRRNRPE